MKKNGFTLAEVLITLAIIGVVAALTLPTLTHNTTNAKIGPALMKAVSAFEQANQALLNEYSADALTDTGITFSTVESTETGEVGNYTTELSNHLKLTTTTYISPEDISNPGTTKCTEGVDPFPASATYYEDGDLDYTAQPRNIFMTKDGFIYIITRSVKHITSNCGGENQDACGWYESQVEGVNPHQQRIGSVFIDINGVAGPNEYATDLFVFEWYNDGSLRPAGGSGTASAAACHWRDKCPAGAIVDGRACAGHVFENNRKVLYE